MTLHILNQFGRTLVLAPHPDDENIGCGVLLALLGRAGAAVQVVQMTDVLVSHRQSTDPPATGLHALRRRGATAPMQTPMQVPGRGAQGLAALGLPHGAMPTPGRPGFDAVVLRLVRIFRSFRPDTVLMPRRGDTHPDHRATRAAGEAACLVAAPQARRLEYPIWGCTDDSHRARPFDTGAVVEDERRELALQRLQPGRLVHDHPQGFAVPRDLLANCKLPVELDVLAGGGQQDVCQ